MDSNSLYYGDNLDILRRYVRDESADLIYLDPPFNSNQTYNVLFQERDGSQSASQIKAFGDTWHWDETAARSYEETVEAGGQVAEAMQAFRKLLGTNDMLAYMSMMAPRLVELRRVLKPTGSLYLHCDPTASHFLKLLMDAVFGSANFRTEIIWKRTSAHSDTKTRTQTAWKNPRCVAFLLRRLMTGTGILSTQEYDASTSKISTSFVERYGTQVRGRAISLPYKPGGDTLTMESQRRRWNGPWRESSNGRWCQVRFRLTGVHWSVTRYQDGY